MIYKLFLDDERYPPNPDQADWEWRIARNFDDACWYIATYGLPSHISFDHDLGAPQNRTGYDFAKWFGDWVLDNEIDLRCFTFTVHSMNPVGAQNINNYINKIVEKSLNGEFYV